MVIEESDFRMEVADDYSTYDLELLYVVNAKNPATRREEMKSVGYNMRLSTCLHKIVNYRLSKRLETVTLEQYMQEFKDEVKKLEYIASMKC